MDGVEVSRQVTFDDPGNVFPTSFTERFNKRSRTPGQPGDLRRPLNMLANGPCDVCANGNSSMLASNCRSLMSAGSYVRSE